MNNHRIPIITVNAQCAKSPFEVRRYTFDLADYDIAAAVYSSLQAEKRREEYSRVWFYRSYR